MLGLRKLCEEPPFSRSLSDTEKKYDTYEKEGLAIIFCVTHFHSYLYGRKFTLVTDHKPLVWFQNSKDPCSRVSRWRLKLAEYDLGVIYKAGKMNVNADALSRNTINDNKEKSKYLQVDDNDTFMASQEKMTTKNIFTRNKQGNSENEVKPSKRRKLNSGIVPNDDFLESGAGFVWVEVPGVRVYSCYFSPNDPFEVFETQILLVEESLRLLGDAS